MLFSLLLLALAAPQDPAEAEPHFLPGERCALCHSNAPDARAMRDEHEAEIAPFDLWQSSMMANASRDPLWRAAMSAEIAAAPSRRAEIQAKCTHCHAPMGAGGQPALLADGVSCTVCHQISAKGLGSPASFSGGFEFTNDGRLYGPHAAPFSMPMRHMTGFEPTQGGAVLEPALCAICHTLFTHALDEDARLTGEVLPEQTPYLEWRNSVFETESDGPGPMAASCQDCHVPSRSERGAVLQTRIARNPAGRDFPPIGERQPFGRHLLVGSNAFLYGLFAERGGELDALASPGAFSESRRLARTMLQGAAELRIEQAADEGAGLRFDVEVRNLAGHKLPTGHPSRRAWLHVRVQDQAGRVLFESGAVDESGRILDARGFPLASEAPGGPVVSFAPRVQAPEQVPVFEAVMEDSHGEPTWLLLRGGRYRKDSRILPRGWTPSHPDAQATAPVGVEQGPAFRGGLARVRYELEVPASTGPLRVEAELLYQTLGARYAGELFRARTPEVRFFRRLYDSVDRRPEVLALASLAIPSAFQALMTFP